MEYDNVKKEQNRDQYRVKNSVAADEVEKNIVGRAVAAHKEHVVVVYHNIHYVGNDAECGNDTAAEGNILFLHTRHTREGYVE